MSLSISHPALRRASDPRRLSDRLFVQAIAGATFPVFLALAALKRLMPAGHDAAQTRRPSIYREALAASRTCGSLALLG